MERVECPLCRKDKPAYRYVVLINCRHVVCRSCLRQSIKYCGSSGLRCPVNECLQLLEEAELQDILENTERSRIEPAPVANHWNWASKRLEVEKVVVSNGEKETEYSSYFSKKDFPELPSKMTENSRSKKVRNVMDDPVPAGGSESYDSFKSSRKESAECNPRKVNCWDSESRNRLRKLIGEKLHKTVDFVCVATESDLTLNMGPVKCLLCQDTLRIYEGVTFPYCSSYFCRSCVTQPEQSVEDVVLMYSDSSDESRNCAVIINSEMRRNLLDHSKSGIMRETKPSNTVSSLVSIYENDYKKDSPDTNLLHNYENCTSSNKPNGKSFQRDSTSDVFVRNTNSSSCELCKNFIGINKGVILRDCYHVLCEECLVKTINATLKKGCIEVRCPMLLDNNRRCQTIVQNREIIQALLTEKQFKMYEKKCLEVAECGTLYHCMKTNCKRLVVIEGYMESFKCPVCSSDNCLSCKTIHQGKSCSAYQAGLKRNDDKDLSLKTKLMAFDANVKTRCPECKGSHLTTPRSNFLRCLDCKHVFSLPTPESKL